MSVHVFFNLLNLLEKRISCIYLHHKKYMPTGWPNEQTYIGPTLNVYVGQMKGTTIIQRWTNVSMLSGEVVMKQIWSNSTQYFRI